jgi:hypothetical protein
MDAVRWLPASDIAQSYAVQATALFRYSQRGMLAARWDAVSESWLYDVFRVRELFPHRATALPAAPAGHLGTLGEARLGGLSRGRRADAREQRQGLHTQPVGETTSGGAGSPHGAGSPALERALARR